MDFKRESTNITGGCYLIWNGIYGENFVYLLVGSIVLVSYGVFVTLQPEEMPGRIFAIYGGFFIVLTYIWSVAFDQFKMDDGGNFNR